MFSQYSSSKSVFFITLNNCLVKYTNHLQLFIINLCYKMYANKYLDNECDKGHKKDFNTLFIYRRK